MFTDVTKLKITKANWYRLNFKYSDELYSIGHHEDIAFIRKMSDRRIIHSWYCSSYNPLDLLNIKAEPIVYKHIDKQQFLNNLNKLFNE